MTLDALVGPHRLDAADIETEREDGCLAFLFRLDGVTYCATEDPDDGYRSCMRDIGVVDTPPANVFPAVAVTGRMQDPGTWGHHVLELVDDETQEVVLAVGTEYAWDYYPCFIARFCPDAMAGNRGR